MPYYSEFGACAEGETCVNGVAIDDQKHYAICVNIEDYTSFGGVGADGEKKEEGAAEVTKIIQSRLAVERGRDSALKVILIGDDSKAVIAQNLSASALISSNVHPGILSQFPRAVSKKCSNCTEIGLTSVPTGTVRLSADMRLTENTSSVQIYVLLVSF